MRIVISSGHGKYVGGAVGYLNEVKEARRVVEEVATLLRGTTEVITFHDDVSKSQNENLNRIVDFHNSKDRDLDVSVHFNAYETTSKPMGTECLYISQNDLASRVSSAVAAAGTLINRGPKKRTDLFFLNETEEPAILIEVCFVDSLKDSDLYGTNFNSICRAVAETISGQRVPDRPPPPTESVDKWPLLKNGSEGAEVIELQSLLGNVVADGEFGNNTEASVRSYQISRGLAVDGIVGNQTWDALNGDKSPINPVVEPLSENTIRLITDAARHSRIAQYNWRDRGKAPIGYINGVAVVYGQVYERLKHDDGPALEMAKRVVANEQDALWYYFHETRPPGVSTLRKLFTLLMGLGMRESSGRYNEGRDMSAENTSSDTAESGLFQQSWNSNTAADEIGDLLQRSLDAPELGLWPVFREGVSPKGLDVAGSGKGAQFQAMVIQCPALATEAAAVCLRVLCNHFGPINRKEVEVRPEAEELLLKVEEIVDSVSAVA